MSIEKNLQLTRQLIQAYNDQDLDRYAGFFADPEVGQVHKEYQRDLWLSAFPDTHMEVTSMTAQGNLVVVEATVRATHTGPLKLWVKETLPATNRAIEFPYCSVSEWENGKQVNLRAYVNVSGIVMQLGVRAEDLEWNLPD